METYPSHVVVSWIGHSETVARKHYLQTTATHFEKATATQVAIQVASDTREMEKTGEPAEVATINRNQRFYVFCGRLRVFAR
jgi:hypothetical protein